MNIPKQVSKRLAANLKRFQTILAKAKSLDVNEADTVTIVTDMLSEIFGYDKYTEITSEYAIRSTFVDLAIKVDDKTLFLVEVKSVGTELKDSHLRQVVSYATKAGVDWAVLTNGITWVIYLIRFAKPISQERIAEFDVLSLHPRKASDIELLYILSAEGQKRSTLEDYHAFKKATSRYVISAILQEDALIKVVRRELKRAFPDVKVDLDTIRDALVNEVLKREVVESEEAVNYKKLISKRSKRMLRTRSSKSEDAE